MTTLEKLEAKKSEVKEVNEKLHKTGNTSEFLNQRVNELLNEEWELRFACAQKGIIVK